MPIYPPDHFRYHFFISYTTREDEIQEVLPTIDTICLELRQLGFSFLSPVFFDRLVLDNRKRSNRQIETELTEALRSSICMLAFVSPGYVSSEWCNFEWRIMNKESNMIGYSLIYPIVWKAIRATYSEDIPGLYPTVKLTGHVRDLEINSRKKQVVRDLANFIISCSTVRNRLQARQPIHINPRMIIFAPSNVESPIFENSEVFLDNSAIKILGLSEYGSHTQKLSVHGIDEWNLTWNELREIISYENDYLWSELSNNIGRARQGYLTAETRSHLYSKETGYCYKLTINSIEDIGFGKSRIEILLIKETNTNLDNGSRSENFAK
jgi:hypothetical protein